ncbi:MAG: sigma-70 region 4 domain-containing protein [Ruminococcus bromii]|nr:sigma-70 region 4 domain-containing protein [Ruminococcus bromii]
MLYLYYAEGYKTDEIAQMLKISPAAVRKRLEKGRKQLKLIYDEGAIL